VPDPGGHLREGRIDTRDIERERRLAVAPRACLRHSRPEHHIAGALHGIGERLVGRGIGGRLREDDVEDDDGRPRFRQAVSELSHSRARPGEWFVERVDRLAVDTDDDHLLVGRRAGEQGIGRTPLEPTEHFGRETGPRDTGDDNREQENRHQPSNQHPTIHDATLGQVISPAWSSRDKPRGYANRR
jgi:hypothetical protein